MGHDEIEQVVAGPDGKLIDLRTNGTYCGSCYGAEEGPGDCCNTCASVRERYRARGWAFATAGEVAQCKRETFAEAVALQAGEGCQIYGHIEVNKVAGNFHFAPGKSFQQGAMHVHDLAAFGMDAYFNMSHVINKLSYGADFPGLVNPLDGAVAMQTGGHMMYQYFIKVVPTLYVDLAGSVLRTAQFSVTENPKCARGRTRRRRASACADAAVLRVVLISSAQGGGFDVGAQPAGDLLFLRHQPHPGAQDRLRSLHCLACAHASGAALPRPGWRAGALRGEEADAVKLPDERVRNRGRRLHRFGAGGFVRVPRPPRAAQEDGARKAHLIGRRGARARAHACGAGWGGGA